MRRRLHQGSQLIKQSLVFHSMNIFLSWAHKIRCKNLQLMHFWNVSRYLIQTRMEELQRSYSERLCPENLVTKHSKLRRCLQSINVFMSTMFHPHLVSLSTFAN